MSRSAYGLSAESANKRGSIWNAGFSDVNACPPKLDGVDKLILYPIGCCMAAASKITELVWIQTGKLYRYTMAFHFTFEGKII